MVTHLTTFDPFRITKFGVGFDSILNTMQSDFFSDSYHSNFPPCNITKKDEFNYDVTLAIAGFSKEDIEVEYADNVLTVKTTDTFKEEEEDTIVHRGIAKRKFTRQWTLADDVVVTSAVLEHGMLTISMEKVVPEGKRKRIIEII